MDEQRPRQDWRDLPTTELTQAELALAVAEWKQVMGGQAAQALRELARAYQERTKGAPAAITSDPSWRLLMPRHSSKQRHAAARAIAATISTHFRNPHVVAALAKRGGGTDRWLREHIFPEALLLAAAEFRRNHPTRIRLGRWWLKSAQPMGPMELTARQIRHWVRQRARAIAEAIILERASSAWGTRARRLSPRERELVRLLVQDSSRAAAARRLNVKPSTLRNMLRRVRLKNPEM